MANIEPRRNKSGEITSYKIVVSSGYDSSGKKMRHQMTWKPDPERTDRQNEKALQKAAMAFEQSIEQGYQIDTRQTVAQYLEYVIDLKEQEGLAPSTTEKYRYFAQRINAAMGHMKLTDVRVQHINDFYKNLAEPGIKKVRATAVLKVDMMKLLQNRKTSRKALSKKAGIAQKTLQSAINGNPVSVATAEAVASALDMKVKDLFDIERQTETLSRKTLGHYHSLLHLTFAQAEKELLIPYNPVAKCTPPGSKSKEAKSKKAVETFQLDELAQMLEAAKQSPIKYQVIIELLIATGCRRGELCALRWDKLDWDTGELLIDRQFQGTGTNIKEIATKTGQVRTVVLSKSTLNLLREYRVWLMETRLKYGDMWVETPYILTGQSGGPLTPASLSTCLRSFEMRNNFPFHIHAHKFRHTTASVLLFEGADLVSVSRWLGHTETTTTLNVYSHLLNQANKENANRLEAVLHPDQRRA